MGLKVPSGKTIEMRPKIILKTGSHNLRNIQFPKSTKNFEVNFNLLFLLSILIPFRTDSFDIATTLCVSHHMNMKKIKRCELSEMEIVYKTEADDYCKGVQCASIFIYIWCGLYAQLQHFDYITVSCPRIHHPYIYIYIYYW